MGSLNTKRNFTFYTDTLTRDILASWFHDAPEHGCISARIRHAIEIEDKYGPYNVQEMMDRGLDKLDEDEESYLNLFLEAVHDARVERMRKIMSAETHYDILSQFDSRSDT